MPETSSVYIDGMAYMKCSKTSQLSCTHSFPHTWCLHIFFCSSLRRRECSWEGRQVQPHPVHLETHDHWLQFHRERHYLQIQIQIQGLRLWKISDDAMSNVHMYSQQVSDHALLCTFSTPNTTIYIVTALDSFPAENRPPALQLIDTSGL